MKKRLIFFTLFLVVSFLLIGCASKLPIETNVDEKVAHFSFTTQDQQTFGKDDLAGNWWIADFIFTNCTTACLPMSTHMAQLQDELIKEDLPVQLVSFTVDPNTDTPQVLKKYGESYGADFTRWTFLTGYDFDTIKKLSVKSFRAFLQAPEGQSDQFTHDTRLFLIDPEGKIVKGYDGLKSESVELIMKDLIILQEHQLIGE